jgi:poly(beta-D-mannuronate) lyase
MEPAIFFELYKRMLSACTRRARRNLARALILPAFLALPCPLRAESFLVTSARDIEQIQSKLRPGDSVIMTNGVWRDQEIVFHGQGTARKPISLQAQTPGQVVLGGKSSLTIEGEWLVVSGLAVKNGDTAQNGILLAGRHCRLTESAVTESTYKFFVHLAGLENRVDHCYLAEKTSESPTLQVEAEAKPNHHRIDHNYFGHRPPLGRNGGETMRVGYSWQSMSNSATVVEQNLFERCDGEIEIISSKSCGNIYRNNTFLDCAGMLTLRHGNGCVVENNFFIAHHKRGSGGIRVIGEDHKIINNYIDGVSQGGIWITSGIVNSPLKGYFQTRNALIAFNTIVDSRGPCLDVSAGIGSAGRTLLPYNVTVANNLFSVPEDGTLLKGQESKSYKWLGNIATIHGQTLDASHPGVRLVDAQLRSGNDGLWRPGTDSPVRSASDGKFAEIKTDFDGQPRSKRRDVGCDQISTAPILNRPLKPADVGPAWLPTNLKAKVE